MAGNYTRREAAQNACLHFAIFLLYFSSGSSRAHRNRLLEWRS